MPSTEISWEAWRAHREPIESGGLSIAAYDLGATDGEPITFLHGYPSSSLDIAPVMRRLSPGWRLLAVDFPGFGASDKPIDYRYSIHAAADAVEQMWRASEISSTVLVAHDYGDSVGQELLARRAEGALGGGRAEGALGGGRADGVLDVELTAVVWMNGGVYPDLHRPTVGQQMLLDPDHGAEVAAAVTEGLFVDGLRVTWGTRRELDEGEVREIWRSMDERGGIALMHTLLHYVADRRKHETRWRDALEAGDPPMTFVWGDLDPVSGAHMIERVEQRIPSARVVRLTDVGHWPLLEAPDVVAQTISGLSRTNRS